MDKTLFLELKPGQTLKICRRKPYYLSARSPLWITWPGSGDLVLSVGASVLVPVGAGCVVAEGLAVTHREPGEISGKKERKRVSA